MRASNRPGRARRLATLSINAVVGIVLPCLCWGCAIAGYAAHAMGPPPVDARYIIQNRPTAIVVKDRPDPSGQLLESEAIASQIEQQIQEHNIAPLVPSVKVADLRSDSPGKFDTMSPSQIGHAVGAEQVIFVQVMDSTTSPGGGNDLLEGQISVVVSVVDAQSGTMLWPTDGSPGAGVDYKTPMLRAGEDINDVSVRRNLYAGLADHVVKLFYRYKPEE